MSITEGAPTSTVLPRSTKRRYMVAMAVDSAGNGVFVPVSLLFFHYVTGLPLVQVGVILTVAALLTPLGSPVAGVLVDRFGARSVVVASYVIQAVGFLCYPFVHSAWLMFVAVAVVAVGEGFFPPGIQSFVADIARGGARDELLATQRSLRNAGLGAGGLITGAVLALGSDAAFVVIVVVTAVAFLVAAVVMGSIPSGGPAEPVEVGSDEPAAQIGYRAVLRDRVFIGITLANAPIALGYSVLAVGLPVYVTQHLGAPDAIVGVLYAVNTVGIALFQIPVTRMLTRIAGRRTRIVAVGAAVFALSFVSYAVLGVTASGLPLLIGVFVATALFTVGELLHGATASAMVAGAAPVAGRGRYMAVYQLSWMLPTALSPALLTALLTWSAGGTWLILAAGVVVAALALLRLESRLPAQAVSPNA